MESNQVLTFIISALVHGILWILVALYNPQIVVEKKEMQKWLQFEEGDATKRVTKATRTRINDGSTAGTIQPQQIVAPPPRPAMSTAEEMSRLRPSSTNYEDDFKINASKEDREASSTKSKDFLMSQPVRVSNAVRQQVQAYLPPELEIGDMAAMNTDQDLYFTFYRRMAEKTYWLWAQNIAANFEKMRMQGQLGPTSKSWLTIVELLLDKQGNVIAIQPMQLSGDYEMDIAPERTFKAAKTYPNPPKDMVEEDGYIRIKYRFYVNYRPMH